MTIPKEELLRRIEDCERRGDFHFNVQPINLDNYDPVDEKYEHVCKGFFRCIPHFLMRGLALFAGFFISVFGFGLTIKGRKNLRGVKSAIVTCNHVNDFDNVMVRQAVFGHRLYIVVGEFNNKKGLFGKMLKAGGSIPLSANFRAMVNFRKAIDGLLEHKNYVLFYPEESEWWLYEKPRPLRNGAFHFAVKANVPVIPIFITFSTPKKFLKYYICRKRATLHILPPIYPLEGQNAKDNVDYLRDQNFQKWAEKYTEFYGKPLVYQTVSQTDTNAESAVEHS